MDKVVPPRLTVAAQESHTEPVAAEVTNAPSAIVVPKDRPRLITKRPVVYAPITHGRSFNLRWSYTPQCSTGQMLVIIDRERFGAPMEVVTTFFPLEKTNDQGRKTERMFMGDRKIGKHFFAGIVEIRLEHQLDLKNPDASVSDIAPPIVPESNPDETPAVTYYRLLYPSGQPMHEWRLMDLSKIRLTTTEDQRTAISAFTGVIYKLQESHNQYRGEGGTRRQHKINHAISDADARALKNKLHHK